MALPIRHVDTPPCPPPVSLLRRWQPTPYSDLGSLRRATGPPLLMKVEMSTMLPSLAHACILALIKACFSAFFAASAIAA